MRVYRVREKYSVLKIIDPYLLGVLLALYRLEKKIEEGEIKEITNTGNIWRYSSEIIYAQPRTVSRKLNDLVEYGLAEAIEKKKGGFITEKIYKLTYMGRRLAETLDEVLFS